MMGGNDSLVASFYNKYYYNFWRPETGIRDGGWTASKTDGDVFVTFILTPCFPSYPSNHASGTGGGLEVMRRLFGAAGHDITVTNNVPALGSLPAAIITLHYSQLKEIADDVDDARVYGGIHWRFDQIDGNVLGRAVATEVFKNYLRPYTVRSSQERRLGPWWSRSGFCDQLLPRPVIAPDIAAGIDHACVRLCQPCSVFRGRE